MKRILCLLALFLSPLLLYGEIKTANSMEEVRQLLLPVDGNTLVIFDIDQTITLSSHPAFQHPNVQRYKHLLAPLARAWGQEKRSVAINLIHIGTNARVELLEPEVRQLIQNLQVKKIPLMALTAGLTGKFKEVKSATYSRFDQLKRLGIDLSLTAPKHRFLCLADLPPYIGTFPEAISGLICANGTETMKGEVLANYFARIGWYPNKVIMIDDSKEQLESFTDPMDALGVDYLGIEYRAIDHYQSKPISTEEFLKAWQELGNLADDVLEERYQT